MEFFVVVAFVALLLLVLEDRRRHARELAGERHRTDQLLDRLMSGNLAEYQTFRSENTTQRPDEFVDRAEPGGRWVHDEYGLNTVWVAAD